MEILLSNLPRALVPLVFALAASITANATPVNDLTKIVLGESHGCGITNSGALRCFGNNSDSQLGIKQKGPGGFAPRAITVLPNGVTDVAISDDTVTNHTCAVVRGELFCWGNNEYGQLGMGAVGRTIKTPTKSSVVSGTVRSVAASSGSTCVIVEPHGALQCWGRNFNGQVGVPEGSRAAPNRPTTIIESGVTTVAVSDQSTCAVANGALKCWGSNSHSQFGSSSSQGSYIPLAVQIPGVPDSTILTVAIGMRQVCVLTGTSLGENPRLLQCTGRAPIEDEINDLEPPPPPESWSGFGTEGIGLSERVPALPRIAQYGLWRGTIGRHDVIVQLNPSKQACDSQYYYRKHPLTIALIEKERRQGKVWKESEGTDHEATWTFSGLSANRRQLTGEWVSKDGSRRLPINLNLLMPTPSKDGEDGHPHYSCYAHVKAFNASRVARALAERTLATSDTLFQGVDGTYRYRKVSVLGEHIQSLAFADFNTHPRLIEMLEEWGSKGITEYYECAFFTGHLGGDTPDFFLELSPQFWSAKLLVLQESYSNYCGGAHPNGGISDYRVWDLLEDRPVEIWKWIKGASNTKGIRSTRLLKLLGARYGRGKEKGDESCADALEGQNFYRMYPKAAGMVFSPSLPHVNRACEEDIEISWAEMRPFLTPAGREASTTFFGIP